MGLPWVSLSNLTSSCDGVQGQIAPSCFKLKNLLPRKSHAPSAIPPAGMYTQDSSEYKTVNKVQTLYFLASFKCGEDYHCPTGEFNIWKFSLLQVHPHSHYLCPT